MFIDEPTSRHNDRRNFVSTVSLAGMGLCVPTLMTAEDQGGGGGQPKQEPEEEVSPGEDLMREHGVLKRILLVYGEVIRRIDARLELPPEPVREGAVLIRTFIEDYHEKLEEDYLFPRFEKAGRLTDLTTVLRAQHQAGRRLTDRITQLATLSSIKNPQSSVELARLLSQFRRMYEPHEAREDTVLFPALHDIISKQELGALGEDFEKKEHQLFGEDGFDQIVDKVASIEKVLGIYDLAQFTPKI